MTQWPQTCNQCGAPLGGGVCPRCNYTRHKPQSEKIVWTGVDTHATAGAPVVLSSGPFSPFNDFTVDVPGTALWVGTTEQRLLTNDDNFVSATLTAGQSTMELWGISWNSDDGFAIPLTATIVGVQVVVIRQKGSALEPAVTDLEIFLGDSGVKIGTNHAALGDWSVGQIATYGSSSDLWGAVLTPAMFVGLDQSIGFMMRAQRPSLNVNSSHALVDQVKMTVYYTA